MSIEDLITLIYFAIGLLVGYSAGWCTYHQTGWARLSDVKHSIGWALTTWFLAIFLWPLAAFIGAWSAVEVGLDRVKLNGQRVGRVLFPRR